MSLLRKYQLVEQIYASSQYVLCRGISRLERNLVLVKTINPRFIGFKATDWLQNEYKLLENSTASGVLKPKGIETTANGIALILENFAGQSLAHFLDSQNLNLEIFLQIAIQVATILQDIHQEQIVHQNLQLDSIWIAPETLTVTVMDFRLACKITQIENTGSQLLEALNLAYISPEQTGRLNLTVDYRSDFYSLGVILYRMITGKLPFEASNPLELIHCHLAQKPIAPYQINPAISKTISQIVSKLLAKDPEARYQTTASITADLVKCQTQYCDRGAIELFELGNLDRLSKFNISQQLYGRSPAIEQIAEVVERVNSGTAEMVLLRGDSGIGKTCLVEQAIQPLIQRQGCYVTGKFEQLNSSIPYAAMIQATRQLIQQLLTEADEIRQQWQEKISTALGKNGKVIASIVPELELIIGSQPDIPELSPAETQNRFLTIFTKFWQLFAQPEKPLVLFLDNLQWADEASLTLIEQLLHPLGSKYLLIIGAYRGREIDSNHQLYQTIAGLQTSTLQLELQPLTLEQINLLLVDSLQSTAAKVLPLAKILLERTQGNPFFIHQLLHTLYAEKLLTFDFESLAWQWSVSAIRATPISNYNVLELVCRHIDRVPLHCQQLLKLAACIGNQFDLETLAHIWHLAPQILNNTPLEFSPSAIAQGLKPAVKAGMILFQPEQLGSTYQFAHHRLHQTFYFLVEETERTQVHFQIGQFLLQQQEFSKIERQVFAIAHHLNLGKKSLGDRSSYKDLAKINLVAGKTAKAANSYEMAAEYLDLAWELLPKTIDEASYQLAVEIHLEAMEVQYLLTNFNRAEEIGNLTLTLVKTVLEEIQVSKIKIHAYIAQNQMQLAIDTGLEALQLLQVSMPQNLEQAQDLKPNLDLHRSYPAGFLSSLPRITDDVGKAVMEILTLILPPVYIIKPQVFPYLTCRMVELCVRYGNSSYSAYVYAVYGLLLCASGEIEAGYQFGELATAIQEQYSALKIKSRVSFIVNTMILPWRQPVGSILEHFLAGINSGLEVGDIEHACFHSKYYCTYLFFSGESLVAIEEKSLPQINLIDYYRQDFQLNYARLWRQLNLNLQGLAPNNLLLIGDSFDESALVPVWHKTNNATSLFAYYLAKLILSYLLQDYQQAKNYGSEGKRYLNAAVGTMCFAVFYFYYSLTLLATCSKLDEQDESMFREILAYQQQMEHWANYAPENYRHKYELVTAEIARVTGNHDRAAEHYDQAIAHAEELGCWSESALAAELAGIFYLAKGRSRIASFYLTDAYRGYQQWGAKAKLEDLKQKYFSLLNSDLGQAINLNQVEPSKTTTESTSEASNLDLLSVIKASQAISSEIILDNLLSKMIEIVMENAGAQRGILLLQQNSTWIVAASGLITTDTQILLPQIPLPEYHEIPISLINYVQNSRETIILDDAAQEGMFTHDPYMIEYQPQSVLCYPIVYQHQLQGIIYLENNFIRGAFTPQKLQVLQVLLSQVSISIENAKLYKNLEDHASVQNSLKQKEILLKEIHHRVKNNLFVVSSLLEFQSSFIEAPEVIKLLQNCQNRIASMALVHQHLYGHSELNKINFAQYTESLVDNLAYAQGSQERNINLMLDLDPIELNIETANPCGLIVNELISNALEHGFTNRDRGNIWLSLKQNSEQQIILTIADDGVGFGENSDLDNSDSLGLELVMTLVDQLNGEINLDKTNGTKIELVFDQLDYQSRI